MNTPRDPSSGVDEDELDERIIWKNDCCRVSGDIAYHLAYTYMRSGKMKYAIEEARLASKFYSEMDDLPLGDPLSDENLIHSYNSNIESDKRIRLRHAWGLIAVITCNMGSNPEIQEECNHALQMVKELHIGPLQGMIAVFLYPHFL